MTVKNILTLLIILASLSLIAIFVSSQNNKIDLLVENHKRLTEKNASLDAAYSAMDQAIRLNSSSVGLSEAAGAPSGEKSGESTVELLKQVQSSLSKLQDRMNTLENELFAYSNALNNSEAQPMADTVFEQPSSTNRTPDTQLRQDTTAQYFQEIDHAILQSLDPQYTQTVQFSYENMITSRDDWAQNTSIKSSECGAEFCKVILNYDNSMDAVARLEFDAMAYSQIPELAKSRSQYRNNPDGTTDIIIHSARIGNELPKFQ